MITNPLLGIILVIFLFAMTRYLTISYLKEERFILASSLRGYSPSSIREGITTGEGDSRAPCIGSENAEH